MEAIGSQSIGADLIRGGLAGVVATVPMTVFMLGAHRVLPKWQQDAVPPEQITDWMLEQVGWRRRLSKCQLLGTALLCHFGFGSTAGVAYGGLSRKHAGQPLLGVAFGLAVYLADYAGWIPMTGILDPPTTAPKGRVAMMVLAHVVYGASLGVVADAMRTVEDSAGSD